MSAVVINKQLAAERLLSHADAFATQLAQWFVRHRRILPWRENPSAYKTVVSELMLQQTQVVTALPYFERWVARWPDFVSLAAASEAEVLQMWEGLGYYSRARNLLKLARAWVAAQGKPASAAEWLAYPGVGPYTAAAIASIAFNEHAAVVDGNVVRILARLCADETAWPSAAHAVKALTPLAQGIIARADKPGLHNEAMMELGATVCRKGQPQCLLCPVVAFCAGKALGQEVEALPRITRKKVENRLVSRAFVVDRDRNAVLLHRYAVDARRLAGLCELPLWQDLAGSAVADSAVAGSAVAGSTVAGSAVAGSAIATKTPPDILAAQSKISPRTLATQLKTPPCTLATSSPPASQKPLLVRRRGIANERIEERFYALAAVAISNIAIADGIAADEGGLFWQPLDALDAVTLTGPHRRWLTQLLVAVP